ncbi:MAG: phosphoribosylformimino-5-aminoimidazole carboxamide ribotide isomerase [Planctomycetota bacterium]
MSLFRPCIDLHDGRVKQIVGGTLVDSAAENNGPVENDSPVENNGPVENFVSDRPPEWYADRYRRDDLRGGHVIQLGPGNTDAALRALGAYPGGLQIGGGIGLGNAQWWLDRGASHVIVTSFLFDQNQFQWDRLKSLRAAIGSERLVIDLSCRRVGRSTDSESANHRSSSHAAREDTSNHSPHWRVASNRWQTITDLEVTLETLDRLADFCDEFLVHAADVEGLCRGVDTALAQLLARHSRRKVVYAGGIASWQDIDFLENSSNGRLDFTVGSALDLFGGTGIAYETLVRQHGNLDRQHGNST